ncbi:hypothetical protein RJJ63_29625 [Rhizobium hidalgonense]|uniref:hypothetical protein n=1 Tax=Rhizobium hidalgonense TaxID=1538159 RepID=UPI002871AABB|nr:hypothetical protein [Rhizobium hidalgonense]MDR9823391.1 hypothetical protein [Rhizobium hidalgonense]
MATITTKNIALGSVCFTLSGIRKMWRELNELVAEQGEIELARLIKAEGQSDEEFEAYKNMARADVFKILGTVEFDNDDALHDTDPEVVKVDVGGPKIRFVYLSNITPYQQRIGVRPQHAFEVVLDFRNPRLLDATSVLSAPTPNGTNVALSGTRTGWQAGVEATVRRNIARTRPLRSWFHGEFIYDLFLLLCGVPLALYVCSLVSPVISSHFAAMGPVVTGAIYLYVGLCALWIYRFLFSYAKWAFPLVEITDQGTTPIRHRALWWSMVGSICAKVFWSFASPSGPLWKVWPF